MEIFQREFCQLTNDVYFEIVCTLLRVVTVRFLKCTETQLLIPFLLNVGFVGIFCFATIFGVPLVIFCCFMSSNFAICDLLSVVC